MKLLVIIEPLCKSLWVEDGAKHFLAIIVVVGVY